MKLAIIIPTYDSLTTLKILIRDILKKTDGLFKIYLIEDGQNEKTIEYMKALRSRKLRKIYNKENMGITFSWNEGLKLALAENCTHFAILNDDIELPERWWNDCQRAFEYGSHLVFLDQPSPIIFTGWFFILDKFALESIGFFDDRMRNFAQDMDYFMRCKSKPFVKYSQTNIKVIHHGATTINKMSSEWKKKNWNEDWKVLREKYPSIRMRDQSI